MSRTDSKEIEFITEEEYSTKEVEYKKGMSSSGIVVIEEKSDFSDYNVKNRANVVIIQHQTSGCSDETIKRMNDVRYFCKSIGAHYIRMECGDGRKQGDSYHSRVFIDISEYMENNQDTLNVWWFHSNIVITENFDIHGFASNCKDILTFKGGEMSAFMIKNNKRGKRFITDCKRNCLNQSSLNNTYMSVKNNHKKNITIINIGSDFLYGETEGNNERVLSTASHVTKGGFTTDDDSFNSIQSSSGRRCSRRNSGGCNSNNNNKGKDCKDDNCGDADGKGKFGRWGGAFLILIIIIILIVAAALNSNTKVRGGCALLAFILFIIFIVLLAR